MLRPSARKSRVLQGWVNSSFRLIAFGFNPLGVLLEHTGSTPTVFFFAVCYLAMAVATQLNPQVRNAQALA